VDGKAQKIKPKKMQAFNLFIFGFFKIIGMKFYMRIAEQQ
jgi:hypothetical protein